MSGAFWSCACHCNSAAEHDRRIYGIPDSEPWQGGEPPMLLFRVGLTTGGALFWEGKRPEGPAGMVEVLQILLQAAERGDIIYDPSFR